MIAQKYIVLLSETESSQTWLGYDRLGRIGKATYGEAFRYDSEIQAKQALRKVQMMHSYPNAKILGTTVSE